MMMASFPWHGASNRASLNQQLILLALVLNCPAVGVWGSRGRECLPGGWELVKIRQGYPRWVPRCQGKAAWENLALGQFCEEEKPERERKRRVWADFHSQERCRGCWWQGPGMPWGVFLLISLRRVRVLCCKGEHGCPDSSPYDKLVSAFMWILI